MSISEHNELKEQFGQLGVNLINTAKKQIKELNQNTLFQKSQIKKNLLKRNNENSLRTKTHFIETYVQLLNNALASTLLETKQEVLEIKNTLLNELRLDLLKRIESNINNNYENYVIYLINELKEFAQTIKSSQKISIVLNERDYKFFSDKSQKMKSLFKTQITLQMADEPFIGGFKAYIATENISYDFKIENYLFQQSLLIESAFSEKFYEKNITELIQNFEKFISDKKMSIETYLKEYDRIG
jgi:vacuolar-type H+-ATPase subunit E/Vma4